MYSDERMRDRKHERNLSCTPKGSERQRFVALHHFASTRLDGGSLCLICTQVGLELVLVAEAYALLCYRSLADSIHSSRAGLQLVAWSPRCNSTLLRFNTSIAARYALHLPSYCPYNAQRRPRLRRVQPLLVRPPSARPRASIQRPRGTADSRSLPSPRYRSRRAGSCCDSTQRGATLQVRSHFSSLPSYMDQAEG